MATFLSDLRLGFRAAARRPGFAALAVATIGLGIGATSAVFSVVRTVLLEPLPYRDPSRLVTLHTMGLSGPGRGDWLSGPEIVDIQTLQGFTAVAAYNQGVTLNLTGDGEPERLIGTQVTGNIFEVLGVPPLLGRAFTAEEDAPYGPMAIVLSENLWRRRFAGDRAIIGRTIQVSGVSRTVVGVMPRSFALPYELKGNPADAWIPFQLDPANPGGRGGHYIYGVARMRDGITVAQADAELRALAQRLKAEGLYGEPSQFQLSALAAGEYVVGSIRPILLLLLSAVVLVLLIACVNVANLLVERAEGRRREFAVRAALGADRRRLLSQLLGEQVILAALGGLLGIALAAIGMKTLVALAPDTIPRIRDVGLDGTVLAFTAAVTAVCALLFGLAPMLHSATHDLHAAMTAGAKSTMSRAQQRTRRLLVAAEFALPIMLLAGAGLTLRTFGNLLAVDPGFDPRGVLTMRVAPPVASYPDAAAVEGFYQQLLQRVRSVPGVEHAGAVRVLPLAAEMGDWSIMLEGRTAPAGEDFDGDWQVVAPGYFEAMKVRLVDGRLINDGDVRDAPQVALINETMARQYWPEGDAIGRRFQLGAPESPLITIVGIVRDERSAGLNAPVNRRFFRPIAQWAQAGTGVVRGMTLVVRTSAEDPLTLAAPVRQIIRELDANLPVAEVRTLESVLQDSIGRQRFTMLLLAVFAAAALLLAAIGVYGVMAFWVTERTREIGVRMALGATRAEVAGLVVKQALKPALMGIAAGVMGALLLSRLVSSLLYDVAPHDIVTFSLAPALLLVIALLAAWLPARRAARQEPVTALHYE